MRRLVTLAVVVASVLLLPTGASAYSFGDWARDRDYSPGDAMPWQVYAAHSIPRIESLDGIGEFDWITSPTNYLSLFDNQISNIEPGTFSGLTYLLELQLYDNQISSIESDTFVGLMNLTRLVLARNQISHIESDAFGGLMSLTSLYLWENQLASIEPGAFSGLTNMMGLYLGDNILTELNLAEADFSNLLSFDLEGNVSISSVSLASTVVNQTSLAALVDGGADSQIGIGELDGVTEMDLSGIDFGEITDFSPLYVMDDLTDLWLVDTVNLDIFELLQLLHNLTTIEGTDTEGVLYMTQANFDAFNVLDWLAEWDAEPGHHVSFVDQPMLGDVNGDEAVNGLDVAPFVGLVIGGTYLPEADCNYDLAVNGLDVGPFVDLVISGGEATTVPEPSTLALSTLALSLLCWRRKGR